MKKRERIKNKIEFDNFIKKTRYIKNNYFILHSKEKLEANPRFGIAVGTKVGGAVVRNRLKRQVRAIINTEKDLFWSNKDYIIVVRKEVLNLKYHEMKEKLTELVNQVKK